MIIIPLTRERLGIDDQKVKMLLGYPAPQYCRGIEQHIPAVIYRTSNSGAARQVFKPVNIKPHVVVPIWMPYVVVLESNPTIQRVRGSSTEGSHVNAHLGRYESEQFFAVLGVAPQHRLDLIRVKKANLIMKLKKTIPKMKLIMKV